MSAKLRVGARVELEVEAVDEHGLGHAPAPDANTTVLVPDAFTGERVEVRIEALARHSPRAHARVTRHLRPSPARRDAPCDRHQTHTRAPGDRRPKPNCGGCPLMTLELDAQREVKRAWIERAYGLTLDGPICGAAGLGYRWSSKRIVAGAPGRLRLGSRAPGRRGELIADMRGCLVDHPRIRACFDALELRANAAGVEPWSKDGGELRYVWAKTDGARVLVTLIAGVADSPAVRELGAWLVEAGHADGAALAIQAGPGNAMRGPTATAIAGVEALELSFGPNEVEVGPLGFMQPNPEVAALAYDALVDGLEPPTRDAGPVLDLYAGAGLTTARLRQRFAEVVPCESHPESAARLDVAPSRTQDLLRAWLDEGRPRPLLVVANPPRAGLGPEVCALLAELGAPRLRIMSCSAKTLAADLERLAPSYRRAALRGFDTLPQTGHLELVAWLERRVTAPPDSPD